MSLRMSAPVGKPGELPVAQGVSVETEIPVGLGKATCLVQISTRDGGQPWITLMFLEISESNPD